MTIISTCPICGNKNLQPFLSCIDHSVSQGTFQLKKCEHCNFILTSPRPDDLKIGEYYISEKYISHTNKAASIIDGIYLTVRSFTLNWKLRIINKTSLPGLTKKLLDYGCGTGEFLKTCKEAGWNISGVEPSEIARTQAQNSTSTIITKSIKELTESDFAAITLWHVLEHISNFNEILQQLKSKLSPTGTIFIAVPNPMSNDAAHYREYWAAYDVPRHLWHFSPKNIELLLENNGLKLITVKPMFLDAFYISLLSEKYLSQNNSTIPGLLKALFRGLKSNLKAIRTREYSSLIYVVRK